MTLSGPPLDAALEHRLERLVRGVLGVEGEVVAEHEEAERRRAQQCHQVGQALDVLAVDLDELQQPRILAEPGIDRGMSGLDERGLSHSPRAPQECVVGGEAARKALGVLDQDVAHAVDALEKRHVDAVDPRDACELAGVGKPDEGVGGGEIGCFGRLRRESLERRGDALEGVGVRGRELVGRGHGTAFFGRSP